MDCLQNAGRMRRYTQTVLYTTLSPCMVCTGTIIQFGIPRVVIGENRNFGGNEQFLRERGIDAVVMNDAKCMALMKKFIDENPTLWDEDIAGAE